DWSKEKDWFNALTKERQRLYVVFRDDKLPLILSFASDNRWEDAANQLRSLADEFETVSHFAVAHTKEIWQRTEQEALDQEIGIAEDRTPTSLQKRVAELEAELLVYKEALKLACESVKEWGAYADEYFQEKWNLEADR